MTTQRVLAAAMVTLISTFGLHATQDGGSAAATKKLLTALADAGLEAIATVDPAEPGTFVAALHIKGGQLLVVRAHHPSAAALSARLAARQFRDVYIDLQGTPTTKGKLFVMDSGADGLPNDVDQPANVDIVYEDGTRQTMFNGARAQKLSAETYRKQLEDADAKYTRLLNVLHAAIATNSPGDR
jgi:hypothetical protein